MLSLHLLNNFTDLDIAHCMTLGYKADLMDAVNMGSGVDETTANVNLNIDGYYALDISDVCLILRTDSLLYWYR